MIICKYYIAEQCFATEVISPYPNCSVKHSIAVTDKSEPDKINESFLAKLSSRGKDF